MVKAYLRYDLASTWGVVSSNSNVCYDRSGKHVITAALENVSVWNLKQAVVVKTLIPPLSQSGKIAGEVTHLAASPVSNHIAVGHADGTIRLWNLDTGDCECTFNGHRTAVTALRFAQSGATLASGSRDTDVVLWDIAAESGLYRLRGHAGQVTDLTFLGGSGSGRLASCSKDETVRVWDLDTQHCCQTVVSHGGEIWSMDLSPAGDRLAVGSVDAELRVYAVDTEAAGSGVLTAMGSLRRGTSERTATVRYTALTSGATLLMCQAAGKVTEVWRLRSDTEAAKRLKRRKKRRKEKQSKERAAAAGDDEDGGTPGDGSAWNDADGDAGDEEEGDEMTASDELEALATIRCKHKVRSATFSPSSSNSGGRKAPLSRLVLSLANNSMEVWDITEGQGERGAVVDGAGHRSDVRAVALSNDDSLCASASNDSVKVWNPRTGVCLRTMDSGYGLCTMFVPGNRHVVVGTKEGNLEIFDVGAAAMVTSIEAHEGAVWSIAPLPDGSGFVTGGADKEVKFWEWDLEQGEGGGTSGTPSSRLGASPTRSMTMTDDVLCVRVSPDGRLLAVALLDSTIRVFFTDSLKFFLSMYGHKLPVLSMSISSDSTLLASGSADKNLRVWGLDFGDCHRSMFAHADSVTQVSFVPNTHYIFTTGKDRVVKYWDADKFEHLLTLEGHHGEVWGMAVSSLGDFVVTAGHDRSIRRWEKTDEPFFVEEEKEKRLESLFEADLENAERRPLHEETPGDAGATAAAGRKTLETVAAADALIEALDLAKDEEERTKEAERMNAAAPPPNLMLLGMSPEQYVLHAVTKVRGSELEQALLLLPFNDALNLLSYMLMWLKRGSSTELLTRVATLLVRLHLQQLSSTPSARPILSELQTLLRGRVQELKDVLGYNLAAMQHIQREINEARGKTSAELGQALLPLKRKALEAGPGAV